MAKAETEITLKVSESEFLALQRLLSFQYHNPSDAGLSDRDKDLLNGIYFEVNRAIKT